MLKVIGASEINGEIPYLHSRKCHPIRVSPSISTQVKHPNHHSVDIYILISTFL